MNLDEEASDMKLMIIDQWVAEGMDRQEAQELFEEMADYGE